MQKESYSEFDKLFPSKKIGNALNGLGLVFLIMFFVFEEGRSFFITGCGLCWGLWRGISYIIDRVNKYKKNGALPVMYAAPKEIDTAKEPRDEKFETALPNLFDIITLAAISFLFAIIYGLEDNLPLFFFTILTAMGTGQLYIWLRIYFFKKRHNLFVKV